MTEETDVNNELEQNQPEEVKMEVHSEVVEETKEITADEETAKPIEETVKELSEEPGQFRRKRLQTNLQNPLKSSLPSRPTNP